ncbi:MAG: tail fiber domain-containing protein [Xanthobacteraceae bacterium]
MYTTLRISAVTLIASVLFAGEAAADFVINDDLIVIGSTCIGFDCKDGEVFSFDTLRLKENNTRIKFEDTSTSKGFPNNKWQLTANDSESGGANKFSIDDVTGAKTPFTVIAGAPTNSMFVDSAGRLGLRTSSPALDVHIATGNTPAHRLEQLKSGGWGEQTWDIAGNEANFFIRDVTSGSKLPFRIRPGAPTSSVDISTDGNVGIGTASPSKKLHVAAINSQILVDRPANTAGNYALLSFGTNATPKFFLGLNADVDLNADKLSIFDSAFNPNAAVMTFIGGNVGIGMSAPAAKLHTTGSVRFEGVAGCGSGIQSSANGTLSCIMSTRHVKNIAGELPSSVALANIMALRPQTGSYKQTPDVPEHWLIAEEVAAVDPALVGLNEGKPYVVKTQNVVADLVAVVQQQQQQIEELRRLIAAK